MSLNKLARALNRLQKKCSFMQNNCINEHFIYFYMILFFRRFYRIKIVRNRPTVYF